MGVELYRLVDTPILLALPLFTYAGYVLGEGQTSQRLVRLTRALVGGLPSGLAIVALFVLFLPHLQVRVAQLSWHWGRCCILH